MSLCAIQPRCERRAHEADIHNCHIGHAERSPELGVSARDEKAIEHTDEVVAATDAAHRSTAIANIAKPIKPFIERM